jgi:acrylyl-CoA reductase (NADPH)
MTESWRGVRVSRDTGDEDARIELVTDLTDDDLMDGDVTIDVEYSSLNFKDGLALTGRPGIVRVPSLLAGIDLVGTVASSGSRDWNAGNRVLVNGQGLGETHHGGFAERARVPASWLVAVPESMSTREAAAIGTAGFTAALAVLALEDAKAAGDILVTGATGGVGSIAVTLLAAKGHAVTAVTGKSEEHDYLRRLGASDILDRAEFADAGKPLQSSRWAGAVDTVGGATLANVLAQMDYGGIVASCGNAASAELSTTVMPFILRAVSLVGINSVSTPRDRRIEAWRRLAEDLDLGLLDSLTTSIRLDDVIGAARRIVGGSVRGRVVVEVRD